MNKYVVDCSEVKTEEEFWDEYASSVEIEDGENFGRNLDALWDALHARGPGTPSDRSCLISVSKTESIKNIRSGMFYDHLRQVAYDLSNDPSSSIKFKVK